MNFSNNEYLKKAINLKLNEQMVISPEDAFFLLINGLDYESLDLLCDYISNNYNNKNSYNLTQNMNLNKKDKNIIFNLAVKCIEQKLYLGSKKTIDGKHNTTSYISHSIYVGKACEKLANMIGTNPDVAQTLGILHDYGRREDHSFNHVIKGLERLVDLGYFNEAIGCLTHSFVKGERCANNEVAIEGFYVDENGNSKWKDNVKKDDLTLFLENYKYTDYDLILNVADLMATDRGIISPVDRIKDIATRRTIDKVNRGFFLSELNNLLIDFLVINNYFDINLKYIKATKDISLKQIENNFSIVSQIFFQEFSKEENKCLKR